MNTLDLVSLNLLSPIVLAFVLGVMATLIRSDLRFPEDLYSGLSIYLLLAIGLKGGAELARTSPAEIWRPVIAALILGVTIPVVVYAVLRTLGRFEIADAAALAAHYGSVSAVTFSASLTFLQAVGAAYEPFVATLVVVMEIPAIVVALVIAHHKTGQGGSWGVVLHEILAGRSIILLTGGLLIGLLAGQAGMSRVAPLFVDLFQGALMLFLLEMGMVAARRLRDLRRVGPFLVTFAIVAPLIQGCLGVLAGSLAGLSIGGATILGTLTASASYIAAPAAVRIALPKANPSYYLTAALGITFPFNLAAGIPIYFGLARLIQGA